MSGPRSEQFDDIYFSPEDGLAETRHVFLEGNNLPDAWVDKTVFTIAETGFGTGLNFLAAAELFARTAAARQTLHYVSFELYPLSVHSIRKALQPWQEELESFVGKLCNSYPLRVPGFHRVSFSENIFLTLVFGDVNEMLPQLVAPLGVDAWFLDGFAPAKNPQMWSEVVFQNIERLSTGGSTFATFTAAGSVRRGLSAAGFNVMKAKGFGRKRDMTKGLFTKEKQQTEFKNKSNRIAIIGAGLAGSSCAFALKRAGQVPVVFESGESIAPAASGNEAGLYNPRFTANRGPESEFYAAAFAGAFRRLSEFSRSGDIGFLPGGCLHLATDEDKVKRFMAVAENGGWHGDHMRYLNAADASGIAGVPVPYPALYLPQSGQVSPAALCRAYAQNIDIRLRANISDIVHSDNGCWIVGGEAFDAVVLACGAAVKEFAPLSWLPVHTVRGQITYTSATAASSHLKSNICYGGYVSAPVSGRHVVGSSFQRWLEHTDTLRQDDHDNLAKLAACLPDVAQDMIPAGSRAGLRTSAQDRLPVVGPAPDISGWTQGRTGNIPGLYVSTAHGSHGIVSSLAAAKIIADMISGAPRSVGAASMSLLAPERFLIRMRRRNDQGAAGAGVGD